MSSKEKINISFSIEGCQKGIIYKLSSRFEEEADSRKEERRCLKNNEEVCFSMTKKCEFHFETIQKIEVIIDKKDPTGKEIYHITGLIKLSNIVISREGIFKKKLGDKNNLATEEFLVIKAEKIRNQDKNSLDLSMKIRSKNPVNYADLKNKFFYLTIANGKKIYKSSAIGNDGKFKNIKLPCFILNPNFSIYFFNLDNKIIGDIETNVEDFSNVEECKKPKLQLLLNKKEMVYVFSSSTLIKEYGIFDYLKAGIRLRTSFILDFTNSNGRPGDKNSPHYVYGTEPNIYEKLIINVGDTLKYYNYDNSIYAYGFGSLEGSSYEARTADCINVNLKDNPNIGSIKEFLDVYRECIKKIRFSSHARFAPVIKKALSLQDYDPLIYNVLILFVNSVPEDLQDTIDEIIHGTYLPLSIVIVGVGDKEYNELRKISGKNLPKYSSKGGEKIRDILHFISLNECGDNEKKFNTFILKEIPKQMIEYYKINLSPPEKIQEIISKNEKPDKNDPLSQSINEYSILKRSDISYSRYIAEKENERKIQEDLHNKRVCEKNGKFFETPRGPLNLIISKNPYCEETKNPYATEDKEYDKDYLASWKDSESGSENNKIVENTMEKFVNTPLGNKIDEIIEEYNKSKIIYRNDPIKQSFDEPKEEPKISRGLSNNSSKNKWNQSGNASTNNDYNDNPYIANNDNSNGNNNYNYINNNINNINFCSNYNKNNMININYDQNDETTRKFINIKPTPGEETPGRLYSGKIVIRNDNEKDSYINMNNNYKNKNNNYMNKNSDDYININFDTKEETTMYFNDTPGNPNDISGKYDNYPINRSRSGPIMRNNENRNNVGSYGYSNSNNNNYYNYGK